MLTDSSWSSDGLFSCVVRITLPEEMQTLVWGCENSLGVDMPDIPRPPKGGHRGDTGGTHSSPAKGSTRCGGGVAEECD